MSWVRASLNSWTETYSGCLGLEKQQGPLRTKEIVHISTWSFISWFWMSWLIHEAHCCSNRVPWIRSPSQVILSIIMKTATAQGEPCGPHWCSSLLGMPAAFGKPDSRFWIQGLEVVSQSFALSHKACVIQKGKLPHLESDEELESLICSLSQARLDYWAQHWNE